MVKMDEINRKILNMLQLNCKASYAEIAQVLKRSEFTVRDRIKRLERAGIVRGYCAVVSKEALGYTTEALVLCNTPPDRKRDVIQRLLKVPNVYRVLHITGERSLLLRVVARDNKDLQKVIQERILPLGLMDVDTHIILSVEERFPPEGIIEYENLFVPPQAEDPQEHAPRLALQFVKKP